MLVVYWILFALVVSSFVRLLWTNSFDPGYLEKRPSQPTLFEADRAVFSDKSSDSSSNSSTKSLRHAYPAPRLSDILALDIFVCQPNGLPRWCSTCRIWRPDRSRHCREKNRCVLKLDHFCPWVGGIVSETSMKFFIQFNTYTFLYTIFDWVLAVVLIAQSRSAGVGIDGNWIAMLILGLFFMGLTGGIGLSAIVNAFTNHTTVENTAEPAGHTWHLALRVPAGHKVSSDVRTITFPAWTDGTFDELQAYFDREAEESSEKPSPDSSQSTLAGPSGPTFAIVESDTFSNPWDVGRLRNWQLIMGRWVWEWFLPLRSRSMWSCYEAWNGQRRVEESAERTFYPTSIDVEALRTRAGLRTMDEQERKEYDRKMASRRTFPYLLGGAGAPKVRSCIIGRREMAVANFVVPTETMGRVYEAWKRSSSREETVNTFGTSSTASYSASKHHVQLFLGSWHHPREPAIRLLRHNSALLVPLISVFVVSVLRFTSLFASHARWRRYLIEL